MGHRSGVNRRCSVAICCELSLVDFWARRLMQTCLYLLKLGTWGVSDQELRNILGEGRLSQLVPLKAGYGSPDLRCGTSSSSLGWNPPGLLDNSNWPYFLKFDFLSRNLERKKWIAWRYDDRILNMKIKIWYTLFMNPLKKWKSRKTKTLWKDSGWILYIAQLASSHIFGRLLFLYYCFL